MTKASNEIIVNVFGKEGCVKCTVLNRRVDKLLSEERFSKFRKKYHDVMTEEGLVPFCLAQCLNPSRIPAMLISRRLADGREEYLTNPAFGVTDALCGDSKLYQYLGLQTDYSDEGKGVITPEMVASILESALLACAEEVPANA